MSARFIALEGGEGVGKSTQARALAAALRARGIDVVETREPGGSPGAEAIRTLLLEGSADRWGPGAEALLFAAARADHVEKTIRPALAAGRWVLSDRFLDSSLAYQGGADRIATDALLGLHAVGSGGLLPDRTLLLTLPEAEAQARAMARDRGAADRFGARPAGYHAAVARAFTAIAAAAPERFAVVDARGVPEAVTARLVAAIADLL
ncbi:MAG: dTMP kinase [Sphingomonadaceae bacterium]|nr:dTMP kinase [Sphingomonadaceae bacterium]